MDGSFYIKSLEIFEWLPRMAENSLFKVIACPKLVHYLHKVTTLDNQQAKCDVIQTIAVLKKRGTQKFQFNSPNFRF